MARRIDYDSPAVMAEARRKLAEMYASEDTAGRTYIGKKLGTAGSLRILDDPSEGWRSSPSRKEKKQASIGSSVHIRQISNRIGTPI